MPHLTILTGASRGMGLAMATRLCINDAVALSTHLRSRCAKCLGSGSLRKLKRMGTKRMLSRNTAMMFSDAITPNCFRTWWHW